MPSPLGTFAASRGHVRAKLAGQIQHSTGSVSMTTALQTPHSTALNITGDITVMMNILWMPQVKNAYLMSKWSATAGNQGWAFYRRTANTFRFDWVDAGGTTRTSEVTSAALTTGVQYWIAAELDVDNGASGRSVRMYYAPDQESLPPVSGWTQLGTTQTSAGTSSIRSVSSTPVTIWDDQDGSALLGFGGHLHEARVYSGCWFTGSATLAAHFQASDATSADGSITSSATGEVWSYLRKNGAPLACVANTAVVVCEGDSLTYGFSASSAAGSYPSQLVASLDGDPCVVTLGRAGAKPSDLASQTYEYTGILRTDVPSVMVLWIGTNDLISSSGAAYWATINSFASAREAEGWQVVICNIIPRGSSGGGAAPFETNRLALNALIASEWATYASGFVDLAGDTRLDDATDTTYFDADQLHLNATGYGVVAELVAAQVNSLA